MPWPLGSNESNMKRNLSPVARPSYAVLCFLACWTVLCINVFLLSSQGSYRYQHLATPPWLSNLQAAHDLDAGFANASKTLSAEDIGFKMSSVATSVNSATKELTDETRPSSSRLISAILPISAASMPHLQDRLATMLDPSLHLHEIVLLSHLTDHPKVRDVLLEVLPEHNRGRHIDVSLFAWPPNLEEGEALLRAAQHLDSLTDRILLMDSAGFDLDPDVRAMLVGPFNTPLPIGPRGFEDYEDGIRCITATEEPAAAVFLVPPFSVAPLLIPPHDLPTDPEYDIWFSLGEHISHARWEGVGGIAVSTGGDAASWCPDRLATSFDTPPEDTRMLQPDEQDFTKFKDRDDQRFVIILHTQLDLLAFSAPICRLQAEGYHLSILLTGESAETPAREPSGTLSILLQPSCTAEVTFLSAIHRIDIQATLTTWMTGLPTGIPGVVVSIPEAVPTSALMGFAKNSTLIQIPREDLPYCDWMGALSYRAWRSWHRPRVDISVITNDRPESLSRLLSSLSNASFFGDNVSLRINIEQTADAETLRVVDDYRWKHGATFIHRRVIHGGLLPAVVESWYPSSNDSYGLMLEDDVELSPLFYAWIKMALLRYRYGEAGDSSPQLFGISLYQQKNLELRPDGRHLFSARTLLSSASFPSPSTPYLSQIPCSWGAVYFPEHWREFHGYLSVRLSETHPDLPIERIVAPGLRSNKWTRSWKKYFIELVYLRGYVMLYPNFKNYVSLSTNHLEVGSHVQEVSPETYERKKKLYHLPLMERPTVPSPGDEVNQAYSQIAEPRQLPGPTDLMDLPEKRMPPWKELPVLDLLGLLATEDVLQARGAFRREEMFHCEIPDQALDVRSLLCLAGEAYQADQDSDNFEPLP